MHTTCMYYMQAVVVQAQLLVSCVNVAVVPLAVSSTWANQSHRDGQDVAHLPLVSMTFDGAGQEQ